ncbi:MAG TPA: TfoX/Sxy family protein [Methanomassiliicoccales archaeon]
MDRKPWPKASRELGERLVPLLEKYQGERRKMFGADVWFINGNMFLGVFGEGAFLRLSDEDGQAIKKEIPGAGVFAPTESTVMREYVSVPASALEDLEMLRPWIERSYAFVVSLPVKPPKKKKPR